MEVLKNPSSIRLIMLLSVVSVFLGRAWQFLFWDAPYRTSFWDEGLLKSLVEPLLKTTWYEYVTSTSTAFARIVANFQMDFFLQTIHQELYGTLYRLSHGLVPLLVILLERKTKDWQLSNR